MQYRYTSLKEVIGNVIRNTRVQDSSYIADIHEWLYEAMEMMETQHTLEGRWENVQIDFHKGKLPCGLRWIDAVEYNGHRLRENGGTRPASQYKPINYDNSRNGFVSTIEKQNNGGHLLYNDKLVSTLQLPTPNSDLEYYYTDMGTINTGFKDGIVTIYYRGVQVDADGFPMIPDLQDYKQALYWYCRAMMIGTGWEDPTFKYEHCFTQWEKIYAPRAIAAIRMPSPEQMERQINTFVRFLPHSGYYDNFFSTTRKEEMYNFIGAKMDNTTSGNVVPQQPYIVGTKPE